MGEGRGGDGDGFGFFIDVTGEEFGSEVVCGVGVENGRGAEALPAEVVGAAGDGEEGG